MPAAPPLRPAPSKAAPNLKSTKRARHASRIDREDSGSEDDSEAADSEAENEEAAGLALGVHVNSTGLAEDDDDGIDTSNIVLGKRNRRAVNYANIGSGDVDGE